MLLRVKLYPNKMIGGFCRGEGAWEKRLLRLNVSHIRVRSAFRLLKPCLPFHSRIFLALIAFLLRPMPEIIEKCEQTVCRRERLSGHEKLSMQRMRGGCVLTLRFSLLLATHGCLLGRKQTGRSSCSATSSILCQRCSVAGSNGEIATSASMCVYSDRGHYCPTAS